ncbi:MAG TPA: MotA/TolQ/ExbB proton channel family protein [Marinobacter sp.]|uniref:MotA/TolQ/ExbB proton channel family protein n=2 Tax=root TaxID=1 RepID=A0A831R0F7_9GAMM|nr:MotA/TolQ/ExbB proton channel family protein [Marinobacter antarcticus]HDZ39052.1 MotA/TolQ/ExbB proton channel family protein [Marinobacter sp.]HEA51873.1 MotA/TolQ/ExbB proton channel family protein [Marinobacter antarcticus]
MNNLLGPLSSTAADGPLNQLLAMGGPVMLVLLGMAVLGLVTFIYLILLGALYAPRLSKKLKTTITLWQQDPARVNPQAIREQTSRWAKLNPLQNLITNTIEALQKNKDGQQVRETSARDAQQSLEPFEAPLKIIEVIAALAPLLGLLGTVLGMMDAFSAMAATEGRANASQLSGGIYEALTTTAAGLIVAIPFSALAAWIEFRLKRIHKVINGSLVSVLSVTPKVFSGQPEPVNEQAFENRDRPRFAHATD